MAIPVRVNEDNYVQLQREADQERRSVIAQLNVILDERYNRSTVGLPGGTISPSPAQVAAAKRGDETREAPQKIASEASPGTVHKAVDSVDNPPLETHPTVEGIPTQSMFFEPPTDPLEPRVVPDKDTPS